MAISHVFSNAIPDGTNTNVVRPSDWNSAHNQYYTLSGNTLGASTVSGTNVVFQGVGNVSLSGTGQTIVFYGTGGGTQSVQTQASGGIAGTGFTSTTTAGTAVVGTLDSQGLSLGVPAYITTAAGGGGVALSAGTQSVSSGTVSFANSNGISFGMSGSNQITASYTVPTQSVQTQASGNIAGSGFSSTTTTGTAIVGTNNSNGLSLGVPAYLTTQSVQTQASGNIARTGFTSTTTTGTAVVGTLNTGGLSLGVPAYLTAAVGGGGVAIGASTQTATSGTVIFSNSNGITFGLNNGTLTASAAAAPTAYVSSVNGSSGAISLNVGSSLSSSTAGSSITFGLASNITTALQSANANYLTSQSNQAFSASGGSSTFQTLNFANSNGVTFSNSGGSVVASYTVPTVPTAYVSSVNGSSGAISLNVGSSLSSSTAGSSITFGLASNITTALQSANANYLTSQSNQAFSASGGSSTFQTLNFANSNGVTFSNSAGSVVASYTVPTAYVSSVNGSSGAISLNVGSSLSSSVNGSSITFGLASNITTALQSTGNYLTTARASNDAIGLNTAATNVTWTVNSSGLSLNAGGYAGTGTSATNASITLNSAGLAISVAAPGAANYSIGVSNLGNTAGSTGITGTRIVFVGTNNISLSQSTDANGATISINQTGGGGGGAMYANLSGNTAGNTTASGNTLNFSGINVTLSGTNNSQIAISAPATSSLVGAAGISISSAGSTISVFNAYISSFENTPFQAVQTMSLNMASVSHAAIFNIPEPLSISYLRIPVLMTTNSTTIATTGTSATGGAAIYSTFNAVVYSIGTGGNSLSLQSVASGSAGFTFSNSISIATNGTQYSLSQGYSARALGNGTTFTTQTSASTTNYAFSTNSFTAFTSARFLDIPFANSLVGGPYWIVFGGSTRSSATTGVAGLSAMTNCNVRYSNHYGVSQTNLAFGVMGSSNLTSGGYFGAGSFSTAGGGTTNSINLSQISSSASHVRLYFQMLRFA